jgi:hypothetical protein
MANGVQPLGSLWSGSLRVRHHQIGIGLVVTAATLPQLVTAPDDDIDSLTMVLAVGVNTGLSMMVGTAADCSVGPGSRMTLSSCRSGIWRGPAMQASGGFFSPGGGSQSFPTSLCRK